MRYSTASFIINFIIRTVNQALISSTGVQQGGSASCVTFNDPVFCQFPSYLTQNTTTNVVYSQAQSLSHTMGIIMWT